MRLAKSYGTVIALLALLAWISPPLRGQGAPPAKASQGAKQPAKTPSASKAQAQPPSAAKQPAKTAQLAKVSAKIKSRAPAKEGTGAAAPQRIARRDPFDPLV